MRPPPPLLARLVPPFLPGSPARRALRAAERARDRGAWREAAALYAGYLALRPRDAGNWVQLGNLQKDTGDPAAAEASYRRALALDPAQADALHQLGHALRAQGPGRAEEAREAFLRAARLGDARAAREAAAPPDAPGTASPGRGAGEAALARARRDAAAAPDDPAARRALAEALLDLGAFAEAAEAAAEAWRLAPDFASWGLARRAGAEAAPAEGGPSAKLLLDISDLLRFVEDTGRVTGIQRVQLGLLEGLLADPAAWGRALLVFLDEPTGPVWALRREDAEALLRSCLGPLRAPARARAEVAAIRGRARAARLAGAEAFVTAGAFWYFGGREGALVARLREEGVRFGALIYDLIPVTHPQHADSGTARLFREALERLAPEWDFALTISRHTARELGRILPGLGVEQPPPIRPVPLAHRLNSRRAAEEPLWPEALRDLRGRDFVLCVGTLESRKNHLALFQAWWLLSQDGGPPPPPLVLVGRPGWLVQDLREQLAATGNLGGLVRLLDGVSDGELEGLYRFCLFTVFPSFTEGWGLPVGESLAAGKLCLASTEGATPEAGEGFADPVDPYDVRALAARVRYWSGDRAALAAAERRIAEGFRPRAWPEVTADFLRAVEECLARPPRPRPAAPGAAAIPAGAALRVAEGEGFALLARGLHGNWTGGGGGEEVAWLLDRSGRLRFAAPEGDGLLALRFEAAAGAEGNALRVTRAGGGGAPERHALRAGEPLILLYPSGPLDLLLDLEGPAHPVPPERRPLRVGFSGLRHLPGPPPPLPAAEPFLFAAAGREEEAGGVELWRAACPRGFGAAGPDGVALAPEGGEALLLLRPAVAAPQRARVQLLLRAGPGPEGELRLSAEGGAAQASLALPPDGGPVLLALETEARPGEALRLRLAFPEGRALALRAAQWGGTGLEDRLSLLEALLPLRPAAAGTPKPAPPEARLRALEAAALGAPTQAGDEGSARRRRRLRALLGGGGGGGG